MFRPVASQPPPYQPAPFQLPTPNLYPVNARTVPINRTPTLVPAGRGPLSDVMVPPYTPAGPGGPLYTPNPLNALLEWWRLKGQLPRNYPTGITPTP